MPRKKTPEIINLPAARLDEIKTRFETGAILEEDKKIILLILSTYSWLYRQLQARKLGIQRLRNLFGFSTEKRPKHREEGDDTPPDLNGSTDVTSQEDTLPGGNVLTTKKLPSGIRKKIMAD
jgi:hypothetical protein